MVHRRVREHIRRMEVRQGWLARRMGVSEGALSLMLTGKRRMTVDELEWLFGPFVKCWDTFPVSRSPRFIPA